MSKMKGNMVIGQMVKQSLFKKGASPNKLNSLCYNRLFARYKALEHIQKQKKTLSTVIWSRIFSFKVRISMKTLPEDP